MDEAVAYLEPEVTEEDVGDAPRTGNTGEPKPLTEKALREASPAVEVFGETLVKTSKTNLWFIVLCVELRGFLCVQSCCSEI